MTNNVRHFYEFGEFRLDATRHRLMRHGEIVPLPPKAIDTLLVLVQNAGRLLEREELMHAVWPGIFVEDANLTVTISNLRKALGQNGENAQYIETIPRIGYRFVANVSAVKDHTPPLVIEKHTVSQTVVEEDFVADTDGPSPNAGQFLDAGLANPEFESKTPLINALQSAEQSRSFGFGLRRRRVFVFTSILLSATLSYFIYARTAPRTNFAASSSQVKSMAVLPFKTLQSDSDDEYLGLSLADALITQLSRTQQFVVRPTSSVQKYVEGEQDPLAAGQALRVEAVLDCSVQRVGERLRVTARLLRVSDGSSLWADRFDEEFTDIFSVQDTISRKVTQALVPNIGEAEQRLLTRGTTTNVEAYQLYLKGLSYWGRRDFEGLTRAEPLFRQAIERDPDFAPAYVGLANTLAMRGADPETELALEKALELAPDLAEAHASRGFVKMFYRWDWLGAERDLRTAVELNPGYGTAHQWLATLLAITGRTEEAKGAMLRTLELDPQSPNFLADMGQMHYFAREYAEAENYCRRALEVAPEFVFAHVYLTSIYLKTGRHTEALEEWLISNGAMSPEATYKNQEDTRTRRRILESYRREGLVGYMRDYLKVGLRDADGVRQASGHYALALHHAALGNRDQAIQWLEKAVAGRAFMTAFAGADPIFDTLRTDPRYQALLRRMRLPIVPNS